MSAPEEYKDMSYGVVIELMSANTSLLMYPNFKDGYDQNSPKYLADIELNAAHAREHIKAALHMAQRLSSSIRETFYDALFYTFTQKNPTKALEKLVDICKILDIHTGVMGIIDPRDHRTFFCVDEQDYSTENAWNLYILYTWLDELDASRKEGIEDV